MILFKNATVASGITKERTVDILFDEKIIEVREDSINPPEEATVIDLAGKYVLPGAIDVHTHFRSDDENWKDYFYNASKAAAKGGITFLADGSCNTTEPLTEGYRFDEIAEKYEGNSLVDYGIWGLVNSDDYPYYGEEIAELSKNGVMGLEFYLFSNNEYISPIDYEEVLELFTDFTNSQIMFGIFPLDYGAYFNSKGHRPDKISKYQFEAVKKLFRRSQETQVHLFNVCSREIVDFIMGSSKKYHCTYDINPNCFMDNKTGLFLPGAQDEKYQQSFVDLIKSGKVPAFSTNSGFVNQDINYTEDSFDGVLNYVDLEYMIPYLFSEYYLTKKMTLGNFERMISGSPAKILGIDHCKGNFNKEIDADLIVIDPSQTDEVTDGSSSFNNKTIFCKIDKTYIRGELVYDSQDGIVDNREYGKLIKRDFQATTLNYY